MLTPRQSPHFYQHQHKAVADTFSLLCWNIHKENLLPGFTAKLHQLLHSHPSDFLLFQEYKMPKHETLELQKNFSFAMAVNMETGRHLYGIFSASLTGFTDQKAGLTSKKEFLLSTRKSYLLTSHAFEDGEALHIMNIHGINFVPAKVFSQELDTISSFIQSCSGSILIIGDFNNWNKKRMRILEAFQQKHSLKKAVIQEGHHIKHVFSKPIDHIFYKGLKLLKAEAVDTKAVSDHNPIHAIFTRI